MQRRCSKSVTADGELHFVVDQTLAWLLQREDYPKSFTDWYLILFQCQNCGAEGQGGGAQWGQHPAEVPAVFPAVH